MLRFQNGVESAGPISASNCARPGRPRRVAILSIGAAMTANRRLLVFSFLIFALFPVLASAATIEFRTLIDVDNNAATGCSVAGMTGVEHVVVTVVKTDATSGAVEQSYRQAC